MLALGVLLASQPAFGQPAVHKPLFSGAGLSETEQQMVEQMVSRWRGLVEDGEGSKEALACLEKAGDVVRLTGRGAGEQRVREEIRGKRFVHLATHGFFATGEARSALAGDGRGVEPRCVDGLRTTGFNPMVLSGVVLAGANASARSGSCDDGMLTAEEVVGLDLRGTELVTLSACETGLGEVKNGEGVMGLRRAFTMAGAASLVMSLWKVPDVESMKLMGDFYAEVVREDGVNKAEAMRTAQQKLRRSLRGESGEDHPFFWAAFIVSGR